MYGLTLALATLLVLQTTARRSPTPDNVISLNEYRQKKIHSGRMDATDNLISRM